MHLARLGGVNLDHTDNFQRLTARARHPTLDHLP